MNRGPLIFLGVFFAIALSWFGMVLHPQLEIGCQDKETLVDTGALYPSIPPGLAREGAEVYRANGCNYCHSQQVEMSAAGFSLMLTDVSTNFDAVARVLADYKPSLAKSSYEALTNLLPEEVYSTFDSTAAERVLGRFTAAGATALLSFEPHGPDIERGWGMRRTVAEDYLYEQPVMLGSFRGGPDLSNVGQRLPDANWHLQHLYAPQITVPGSVMPPYRYLFEKRAVSGEPSPDALQLTDDAAPGEGFEVVPKPEARALVAYLLSRRVEHALFEAPLPVQPGSPAESTNTVEGATNAVPTRPDSATAQ